MDVGQGSSFKIVLASNATLGTVSVFAAKHFYKLGLVEEHNGKFFGTMLSGFSASPNTNQELEMPQNGRIASIPRFLSIVLLFSPIAIVNPAFGQFPTSGQHPERPTPPTRDPNSPGYVKAKELADGSKLPANTDGNFIIGPTHNAAPEMSLRDGILNGTEVEFTMSSSESKIYPGIARDANTFGTADPADPAKLIVTTSHPAPYTRKVAVYVPKQYVRGSLAPFIVGTDGPDRLLFSALDTLIAQQKVPMMIAISIGNGGGDAQGSERGLEYDTMSGVFAEFVEKEVLPMVETQADVKLTKDPNGRATMGYSSGGACALIMAWYHPELYHRVLTYSGTFVNQAWPYNPQAPHGAWEFHERLIPNSPAKPIRIWMEVGDRDLFNPNVMRDNMHDWVLANENMAKVLAAKGYHYQFVFARNATHVDRAVVQQALPEALQYIWQDYRSSDVKKDPLPPERDDRSRTPTGQPVTVITASASFVPSLFGWIP